MSQSQSFVALSRIRPPDILSAAAGGRTTGTAASLQQRRRGADKLWMCPFAANCLQWKPFPIMQLEGREKEGRTAAVGKRTKLFVRPFSAPLFKFTLCSALPRSLQESDEKQPESREEREQRISATTRARYYDFFKINAASQPSLLLFFNAKEKYATAHRESLPSLFPSFFQMYDYNNRPSTSFE